LWDSGTSHYSDVNSDFIWRFPIAFQIVPLIFLAIVIWAMPESPRWLIKVGREEEGRFILGRLRGEGDGQAEAEFQDIHNIVELERKTASQNSYLAMLFGWKSGKLHTGRRVQLVVWLQILQEWIGIAGITIFGPTIFGIAGITAENQLWVSGLNDITYMVSNTPASQTMVKLTRRSSPLSSASSPSIVSAVVGLYTGAPSAKVSACSPLVALPERASTLPNQAKPGSVVPPHSSSSSSQPSSELRGLQCPGSTLLKLYVITASRVCPR